MFVQDPGDFTGEDLLQAERNGIDLFRTAPAGPDLVAVAKVLAATGAVVLLLSTLRRG